jgi:uncharacterized protein GlcG (DUF336 family)
MLAVMSVLVISGIFAGGAAQAQVPDAMPVYVPYGAPITLERAKKVADAAEAEARKRNWKMAIAIVEPSGDLVYYVKIDDTQYASAKVAVGKARSAAIYRRPTKAFFDAMESGHPYVATLEGMVGSEGGVLIVENGKLIGAIGVSGGSGAQDGVIAKAGADTVK